VLDYDRDEVTLESIEYQLMNSSAFVPSITCLHGVMLYLKGLNNVEMMTGEHISRGKFSCSVYFSTCHVQPVCISFDLDLGRTGFYKMLTVYTVFVAMQLLSIV
jgi:hypothetical protein